MDQDQAATRTPQQEWIERILGANASTFLDLNHVISEEDILLHTTYIRKTMIPQVQLEMEDPQNSTIPDTKIIKWARYIRAALATRHQANKKTHTDFVKALEELRWLMSGIIPALATAFYQGDRMKS